MLVVTTHNSIRRASDRLLSQLRREPPSVSAARAGEQACVVLLRAFSLVARRGEGLTGWAAPFRHDPIAFLLDSMSDAANLWSRDGHLLFRNRAASELDLGYAGERPVGEFQERGRRFERRTVSYQHDGRELLLEIIRALP